MQFFTVTKVSTENAKLHTTQLLHINNFSKETKLSKIKQSSVYNSFLNNAKSCSNTPQRKNFQVQNFYTRYNLNDAQ